MIRWRRIEVDRAGPGRLQVRWIREHAGVTEHLRIEGRVRDVLVLLPTLVRWRWFRTPDR